jgi:CDP-diglyceride synthetase
VDRNLQLRILTALSLGLGFVAAIYFSVYATIALFAAILILGLFELFKIINACDAEIKPNRILAIWLALVVYGMLAVLPGFLRLDMLFPRDYFLALGLLFVLILVLFVAELFRNQTNRWKI